jgi:hypothetical protein
MAYNPGVQDRSGEILAQGISQGFSSLTRGIELGAQRRKEKEDEIKTSNAALKSFESTMKGLIDAGMMKPEMLDSITDARGMDSKGRMEFVTRGFQSLPAFLSANQIQTERAKNAAALEQNRLAQQDFANINAPTQSLVPNQMGMGASFEQLSQGPGAFQQKTADLNAKIQRVYAAPNIDPDKKPGIINALIAQDEAGKPPKPQNLGFNEQAVAAEIAAQRASLGREPTPAETSAIYKDVAQRSNPSGDPEATARIAMLAKELPLTGDRADVALRILPTINSLSSKLDKGLKTGKLEDFKMSVVGYAKGLGIPVDEAALGSSEAAQAQFGQFLFQLIALSKGSTSERENSLFTALGPELGKSPAANKELLGLLKAQTDLDVELGRIYRTGRNKDDKLTAIAAKQQEARDRFAKKYDDMLSKAEDTFGVTYEDKVKAAIGN